MQNSEKSISIMKNPLIAVVCDIRGFTEFTSAVDSVNKSEQVDGRIKKFLLEDYDKLVAHTQSMAVKNIIGPLIFALKNEKTQLHKAWLAHLGSRSPLPCALKSTGDGFLLAIELATNGDPVSRPLQCAIAKQLMLGATKLVSAAKAHGEFRRLLVGFFKRWQDYIALQLEDDTFRVASAVAVGTGQVSDRENVPDDWKIAEYVYGEQPKNPAKEREAQNVSTFLKVKGDAYGHGVNLAFRLCDRAGRKKHQIKHEFDPYILLDRRVGHLLIDNVPIAKTSVVIPWHPRSQQLYRMLTFPGYSLARFTFREPLKGIDELWCYALEEKAPSTKVQRGGKAKKGRKK